MGIIILTAAIVFILIIGYLNLKLDKVERSQGNNIDFNYIRRNSLLNKTENIFFNKLLDHLSDQFYISTKVRLWDIVEPSSYANNKIVLENKIKSKHLDFVIFEKVTTRILLVIELDGNSHLSKARIDSDNEKNRILESADIKFVRIKVSSTYDFSFLQDL